jgi:hypothetical protein
MLADPESHTALWQHQQWRLGSCWTNPLASRRHLGKVLSYSSMLTGPTRLAQQVVARFHATSSFTAWRVWANCPTVYVEDAVLYSSTIAREQISAH